MNFSPFKIIIWVFFLVFVLVNSVRLFIYGFVISFIIVIIDRAFFGTRKRSDTQFLNLFFVFTTIFALCYTFSPYFRAVEFKISHPKWQKLEIVSIESFDTRKVTTPLNFLEKEYTAINVVYKNDEGVIHSKPEEIKHYALVGLGPLFKKSVIEAELDYIHKRSLEKLLYKKSINLYQHPLKNKLKVFKGNDAFAIRHSIGFQIALLISYISFVVLSLYFVFRNKEIFEGLNSSKENEKKTAYIVLGILLYSSLVVCITIIHYLKF